MKTGDNVMYRNVTTGRPMLGQVRRVYRDPLFKPRVCTVDFRDAPAHTFDVFENDLEIQHSIEES